MKVFLYLDDDAFHPQHLRDPQVYYPLIGRSDLLELLKDHTLIKVITVEQAIAHCQEHGCPNFISFDNDLCTKLEGRDLCNWLIETDLDHNGQFFPKGFNWFVHSQNPIAAKAINDKLSSYMSILNTCA